MSKKHKEENLNGTLVATLTIGFIIIIMWFCVWQLFLNRG